MKALCTTLVQFMTVPNCMSPSGLLFEHVYIFNGRLNQWYMCTELQLERHITLLLHCVCVCVCECVLPENEDLVQTSYIQTVDAPLNVDVRGLGR